MGCSMHASSGNAKGGGDSHSSELLQSPGKPLKQSVSFLGKDL